MLFKNKYYGGHRISEEDTTFLKQLILLINPTGSAIHVLDCGGDESDCWILASLIESSVKANKIFLSQQNGTYIPVILESSTGKLPEGYEPLSLSKHGLLGGLVTYLRSIKGDVTVD